MAVLTLQDRLADLYVRGGKIRTNFREAATAGHVELDASMQTEVTFTFVDPDLQILASNLFTPGTEHKAGAEVDYQGLILEVAAAEISPEGGTGSVPHLQVTCHSRGVQALKRRIGPLTMTNASPTDFVTREARAVGLKVIAQPTAKQSQIARDVKRAGDGANVERPSSWTTMTRLAGTQGFLLFEAYGTLYFGTHKWLVDHTGVTVRVDWLQPAQGQKGYDPAQEQYRALKVPHCRRTANDYVVITATGEVPYTRAAELRPGARLDLRGVPTFSTRSLILTKVSFDLAGEGPVTFESQTPTDDVKPSTQAGLWGSTSRLNTRSALDFIAYAESVAGSRYVFGAAPQLNGPTPVQFDCSSLVEWAAYQVGITLPRNSAAQYAVCKPITVAEALNTPGALLFLSNSQGVAAQHVGISLGDGISTMEARDTQDGVHIFHGGITWDVAGLIPGMIYPKSGS